MLKQKILSIITVLAVTAFLLTPIQTARAALIPLNLANAPTIVAGPVAGPLDINYQWGTLNVDGPATFFYDGTDLHTITDAHPIFGFIPQARQLSITAEIDSSGQLVEPYEDSGFGDIRVIGQIPTAGVTGVPSPLGWDDNLLLGSLTGFGFPDAPGDPLEFVFEVTGGQLTSYFPLGSELGVILTDTEFPGSFAQNWHNMDLGPDPLDPSKEIPVPGTGQAIAEVGIPTVIPEPGSLLLIGSGLIGLVGLRRIR